VDKRHDGPRSQVQFPLSQTAAIHDLGNYHFKSGHVFTPKHKKASIIYIMTN